MEYSSLEFVYLRPIFIALLLFLSLLLVIILIQKGNKLMNSFSIYSILIGMIAVSSLTLVCEGYIVDAYGLGGDAATFYMWEGIVGLSAVNFIAFQFKQKQGVS
ncbi:hypothetical protein [Niallia nealsonii]|uniref:Uncharacterized protein n=1 Tax=Niallia nealsonii TaxID=115979 RepID=A0A2N0Z0A5_9BACI|nr:hypothetical protein [Niallia nealsonii]PKG22940.1 hypothetical protein CWS01_14790 [Niallia nealsonii]